MILLFSYMLLLFLCNHSGWSWTRRGGIFPGSQELVSWVQTGLQAFQAILCPSRAGHVLFEEPGCESKGWPEQAKILGQGRLLVTLVSYMCRNKRTSQVLGTEADYYVAEAHTFANVCICTYNIITKWIIRFRLCWMLQHILPFFTMLPYFASSNRRSEMVEMTIQILKLIHQVFNRVWFLWVSFALSNSTKVRVQTNSPILSPMTWLESGGNFQTSNPRRLSFAPSFSVAVHGEHFSFSLG